MKSLALLLLAPALARAQSSDASTQARLAAAAVNAVPVSPSGITVPKNAVRLTLPATTPAAPSAAVVAGNFLVVPFGRVEPVLTCARLRVCVIALEDGESIVGELLAGDAERWSIKPERTGPGGRSTLVAVKPKDCDLTTNLVIPTDRRVYDVTLDSPACSTGKGRVAGTNPHASYLHNVRFTYDAPFTSFLTSANEGAKNYTSPDTTAPAPAVRVHDYEIVRHRYGLLHFFRTKPLDFPWVPKDIAGDSAHVYVTLPDAAAHEAAPVLYDVAWDGTRTLVNFTLRDERGASVYVTDRPMSRGVLVLRDGAREHALEFERKRK